MKSVLLWCEAAGVRISCPFARPTSTTTSPSAWSELDGMDGAAGKGDGRQVEPPHPMVGCSALGAGKAL